MNSGGAFHPAMATGGGVLIGLGLLLVLLVNRRPTGVSGVAGGLMTPVAGDNDWRVAFLVGLVAGGLIIAAGLPGAVGFDVSRSLPAMAVAGLLVGVGTRLGNGCTSGHGVCGIARLSPRSLVATLVFMVTGAITVYLVNHVWGGRL